MKLNINIKLIGALTSKPYAFTSRSWELDKNDSIDVFDSMGSNLVVNFKGLKIVRVLPGINDLLNQEWITNKARFSFEGFYKWRFTVPLLKKGNIFKPISWSESFNKISKELMSSGNNIDFYSGDLDRLSFSALNLFANNLYGKNVFNLSNELTLNSNILNDNGLNFNYSDIHKLKNVFVFNCNLRFEQPLLNVYLRNNNVKVFMLGSFFNANYAKYLLGNNSTQLLNLIKGKHPFCFEVIKNIKLNIKCNLIIGQDFFKRSDSFMFLYYFKTNDIFILNILAKTLYDQSKKTENSFSILNNKNHLKNNIKKVNFLVGNFSRVDKRFINNSKYFNVFQGSHNKKELRHINLILPTSNHYESTSIFSNSLWFKQQTFKIIQSPQITRPHWQILKALSDYLFQKSKIKTKLELNDIDDIINYTTKIKNCDWKLESNQSQSLNSIFYNKLKTKFNFFKLYKTNLKTHSTYYYNSDIISKSSKTMIQSFNAFETNNNNFYYG